MVYVLCTIPNYQHIFFGKKWKEKKKKKTGWRKLSEKLKKCIKISVRQVFLNWIIDQTIFRMFWSITQKLKSVSKFFDKPHRATDCPGYSVPVVLLSLFCHRIRPMPSQELNWYQRIYSGTICCLDTHSFEIVILPFKKKRKILYNFEIAHNTLITVLMTPKLLPLNFSIVFRKSQCLSLFSVS